MYFVRIACHFQLLYKNKATCFEDKPLQKALSFDFPRGNVYKKASMVKLPLTAVHGNVTVNPEIFASILFSR